MNVTKREAASMLRSFAREMRYSFDASPRDIDRWAANIETVADDLDPRAAASDSRESPGAGLSQ